MIVRCSNCQTEFSLDDRQVGPEGAMVRCSVCAYVFRVMPGQGGEADQPWQIRTVEDLLFTAPDLATLVQWIEDGRLHPEDQVSRTGRYWVKLGEMPEFSRLFEGFEGLSPLVYEESRPYAPGGAVGESAATPLPPAESFRFGPPPAFGNEPPAQGPRSMLEAVTRAVGGPEAGASGAVPLLGRTSASAEGGGGVAAEVFPSELARPSPVVTPEPSTALPPSEVVAGLRGRPDAGGWATASGVGATAQPLAYRSTASPTVVAPGRRGWWVVGVALAGLVLGGVLVAARSELQAWLPLRQGAGTEASREVAPIVSGGAASPVAAEAPAGRPELPELVAAREARHGLDHRAVARAEAGLQRRLDERTEPAEVLAALQLAQVELLAARSVELQIASALRARLALPIDERSGDPKVFSQRATAIFDVVPLERVHDRDRIKTVRAELRLAEGRTADEIVGLLPDAAPSGDEEGGASSRVMRDLLLVVESSGHWQSSEVQAVDPRHFARLRAAAGSGGSTLVRLCLALLALQQNDEEVLRQAVVAILEDVPNQPSALALREALEARARGDADPVAPSAVVGEPPTAEPRKEAGAVATSSPSGGTLGADQLIARGCAKADGADPKGALALLLRAHDLRPGDLDAMACLGRAYGRLGQDRSALAFYERALGRAARYLPALVGAAESAVRLGETAKAVRYHEKILEVDPSRRASRAYLENEAHKGKRGDAAAGTGAASGASTTPAGASTPRGIKAGASESPARLP